MGQLKPWTAAALKVLDDGEWHARENVIAAGVTKVPPGLAFRRGERARRRSTSHKGTPAPVERAKGDDSTAIGSGARGLLVNNLITLVRNEKLERAVVDGVDSLRLTPPRTDMSDAGKTKAS